MPQVVFLLWAILLIVTILLLPMIVSLLHQTWKAAHRIEIYFKEMKKAGLGVADNTDHIPVLDNTIEVASGMLEIAGGINEHANTIKEALSNRADKLN